MDERARGSRAVDREVQEMNSNHVGRWTAAITALMAGLFLPACKIPKEGELMKLMMDSRRGGIAIRIKINNK